jgi:hypothetical protein
MMVPRQVRRRRRKQQQKVSRVGKPLHRSRQLFAAKPKKRASTDGDSQPAEEQDGSAKMSAAEKAMQTLSAEVGRTRRFGRSRLAIAGREEAGVVVD